MRVSNIRCSGRADPFGLLVVVLLMALSVTILIQAQASSRGDALLPMLVSPPCLSTTPDCGMPR
jgi:hypothetical protein